MTYEEEIMTTAEVCDMLRVQPLTVHRWIKRGDLKAILIGRKMGFRIKRSDLEAFLESRQVIATEKMITPPGS